MDDTALAALNSMVLWEVKKHEPFFDMEDLISGRALAVAYLPSHGCHLWKVYIGRLEEMEVITHYLHFGREPCGDRIYLKLGDEEEVEVRDFILPMHETETYQERRKKQDAYCCP